jgi:DNA-binding MarR family transcriptional regulator
MLALYLYLMKEHLQDLTDMGFGAMDFFLMALVDRADLTSLYALQQKANLQPGSLRAVLQRLEGFKLIERAESASRRRRDLSLTALGTSFLNDHWRDFMMDYPDAESVIRVASVALLMGDASCAADYLLNQSLRLRQAGKEKEMEAERLFVKRQDPVSSHAWMRALTEAQRREGESDAFSKLSLTMKENH